MAIKDVITNIEVFPLEQFTHVYASYPPPARYLEARRP
jgi:hypothetical protein